MHFIAYILFEWRNKIRNMSIIEMCCQFIYFETKLIFISRGTPFVPAQFSTECTKYASCKCESHEGQSKMQSLQINLIIFPITLHIVGSLNAC